jgi:hypothetical protein
MHLAGYEPRVRWAEAAVPEPVRARRGRPFVYVHSCPVCRAHWIAKSTSSLALRRLPRQGARRTADRVAVRGGGCGNQLGARVILQDHQRCKGDLMYVTLRSNRASPSR